MSKQELLEWINRELKRLKDDNSSGEWWRGRDCGWEEALTEIKRIYYWGY